MGDLTNAKVIWLKGLLFLGLGLISAVLLVLRHPEFMTALLLVITIWAFCRCYYFAFYVIEKYVDPSYRFAGLTDFLRYAAGARRASDSSRDTEITDQ